MICYAILIKLERVTEKKKHELAQTSKNSMAELPAYDYQFNVVD